MQRGENTKKKLLLETRKTDLAVGCKCHGHWLRSRNQTIKRKESHTGTQHETHVYHESQKPEGTCHGMMASTQARAWESRAERGLPTPEWKKKRMGWWRQCKTQRRKPPSSSPGVRYACHPCKPAHGRQSLVHLREETTSVKKINWKQTKMHV